MDIEFTQTQSMINMMEIIYLAILIALAYWVYNDAEKRGNDKAILWGIATFLFPIFALLYYLIARK